MNMPDMSKALEELKEAVMVMNGLQERHTVLLKDHAEWLHEHDKAMLEIRENGRETDKRIADLVVAGRETDKRIAELGRETDKRISDLVIAISDLVRKLP
jgi:Tfp pilus assembly pilus retraction ATPase PilT